MKEVEFRQPIFVDGKFIKFHFWGMGKIDEVDGFRAPLDFGKDSQQFTGLADNDGIRIFEGDIVKIFFCYVDEILCGKVIFNNGAFLVDCGKYQTRRNIGQCPDLKIIGNVYETPELLEK